MKTIYQVVLFREYGNKTIIYESDKYNQIKEWLEVNSEKFINKHLAIQETKIIKSKV